MKKSGHIKGNKTSIKKSIEFRRQEKPVIHIETVRIAVAISPGLCMTCPQKLGDIDTRNGALSFPVVHERFPVDVLADALADKTLSFRSANTDLGLENLGYFFFIFDKRSRRKRDDQFSVSPENYAKYLIVISHYHAVQEKFRRKVTFQFCAFDRFGEA